MYAKFSEDFGFEPRFFLSFGKFSWEQKIYAQNNGVKTTFRKQRIWVNFQFGKDFYL